MKESEMDKLSARAKERYGLDLSESKPHELIVDQPEHVRVGLSKDSRFMPYVLKTARIKDVKRWVGRPSGLASKCNCARVMRWHPPGTTVAVKDEGKDKGRRQFKKPDVRREDLVKVRDLTRAYLNEDDERLSMYESFIDSYWQQYEVPIWIFNNIVVGSGAVVEVSGGATGVLLVNNLTINDGGKLLTRTTLTIDARVVEKA